MTYLVAGRCTGGDMRVLWTEIALATLWLAGCDLDRKPEQANSPVAPPVALTRDIPSTQYHLADEACQKDEATPVTGPLVSADIFTIAYNAERLQSYVIMTPENTEILGIRSDALLHSSAVGKLLYGARYERICREIPPHGQALLQSCLDGNKQVPWRIKDAGYPLRICHDPADYPRESYEAVALTSLYHVEKAFHAITIAFGRQLPPITVEILPHYVSFYPGASGDPAKWSATYFSHNLAYFPGRNLLVVFPEADKGNALFDKNGHLWESPFAIGHEIGHHLEHEILTLSASSFVDNDEHSPLAGLMRDRLGLLAEGGVSGLPHLVDALLEGFADLVGYYVTNHDENGIKGLVGFGINRNPQDPWFHYDNQPTAKQLDTALLSRVTDMSLDISQRISDNYKVGSVMAYAMQSLISIITTDGYRPFLSAGSRFEGSPDSLRLALAIAWFTEIYRQDSTGLAVDVPLAAWSKGVERMLPKQVNAAAMPAESLARLHSELCRKMREIAPVVPPPFGDENGISC